MKKRKLNKIGNVKMVTYSFEGRIRKVWQNDEKRLCEIYGTEKTLHNGVYDIAEDVIQEAKEFSRVPQILTLS